MAGHSHAHNIKHKKNAVDAKRAKIFTKLCREISSCVKQFGPESPRLKMLLDDARKKNLPKDNIDRAIKKGSDNNDADNMQDIVYEGFANDGVALIIEACTDNKHRTAGKIRAILSKYSGGLGASAYLFKKIGVLYCQKDEQIMNKAIELGAIDMYDTPDHTCIICNVEDIFEMRSEINTIEHEVIYQATDEIELIDEQQALQYNKMIAALEDVDDIDEVYSNVKK